MRWGLLSVINCLLGSHKPGLDGDRETARGKVSQKKKLGWVEKCSEFSNRGNILTVSGINKYKTPTLGQ